MRRLPSGRYAAFALAFLAALLPHAASAALFNGTIIPQSGSCVCADSAPDWGCVLQVLQNVINFAVYLGVILCVIWIAYGGFSMVVSGGSAEARSTAKTRLLNAVVGIIVILCSWLIVDFVMKTVYDQGKFGPWNAILAPQGDAYCIKPTTPSAITSGTVGLPAGTTQGGAGGGTKYPNGIGVAKGLCADSNTSCSPAAMKREGLTDAQANAMSCIAVTESAGGQNKGNSGTGAVGLFQITGQNWNRPEYHRGLCSAATSRLDDACNRQAAVLMFKHQGYQPWTGKCNKQAGCGKVSYGQYWNPNAVACVNKYDPQ